MVLETPIYQREVCTAAKSKQSDVASRRVRPTAFDGGRTRTLDPLLLHNLQYIFMRRRRVTVELTLRRAFSEIGSRSRSKGSERRLPQDFSQGSQAG